MNAIVKGISSRPTGLYHDGGEGVLPDKFNLDSFLFNGQPLWDRGAAQLMLALHFSNTLDLAKLKSEYGLEFVPHVIGPFAQRYNAITFGANESGKDLEEIPMKQCTSQMRSYTPKEFGEKFVPQSSYKKI
jgi:hypothetical protein